VVSCFRSLTSFLFCWETSTMFRSVSLGSLPTRWFAHRPVALVSETLVNMVPFWSTYKYSSTMRVCNSSRELQEASFCRKLARAFSWHYLSRVFLYKIGCSSLALHATRYCNCVALAALAETQSTSRIVRAVPGSDCQLMATWVRPINP
jgi:hypothetical protein